MMTTPLEIWRAGFVFWTRTAELQMALAGQWMGAFGLRQRQSETPAGAAMRAPANAISAPVPKALPKAAPKVVAKAPRGTGLAPPPRAVH